MALSPLSLDGELRCVHLSQVWPPSQTGLEGRVGAPGSPASADTLWAWEKTPVDSNVNMFIYLKV